MTIIEVSFAVDLFSITVHQLSYLFQYFALEKNIIYYVRNQHSDQEEMNRCQKQTLCQQAPIQMSSRTKAMNVEGFLILFLSDLL